MQVMFAKGKLVHMNGYSMKNLKINSVANMVSA